VAIYKKGGMKNVKRILLTFFVILTMAGAAFAAHPLITDDTGTQGKGKFQLEVNSEFDHEDEDGTKEDITLWRPLGF
jgi:hypothetical protein